jgi:hypothetical protein
MPLSVNIRPVRGGQPRVLDLFCCAGGAAVGYHRAGFAVEGCGIVDRPNYPFPYHCGDALAHLAHLITTGEITQYALVHASPACQRNCTLTLVTNTARGWGRPHSHLIGPLRELLDAGKRPYVIEQPNGSAPIRKDEMLCGMFGLGVTRHRNFEVGGWNAAQPAHVPHRGRVRGRRHGRFHDGPYVAAYGSGGGKPSVPELQASLGITRTSVREELIEAIPPSYTHWIGRAFIESAREVAA